MDVVVNASFSGPVCLAGRILYLKIFHEGFVIRPPPGGEALSPPGARGSRAAIAPQPRLAALFRHLRNGVRSLPARCPILAFPAEFSDNMVLIQSESCRHVDGTR